MVALAALAAAVAEIVKMLTVIMVSRCRPRRALMVVMMSVSGCCSHPDTTTSTADAAPVASPTNATSSSFATDGAGAGDARRAAQEVEGGDVGHRRVGESEE